MAGGTPFEGHDGNTRVATKRSVTCFGNLQNGGGLSAAESEVVGQFESQKQKA